MKARLPPRLTVAVVSVAVAALALAEVRVLQASADRAVGIVLGEPLADGSGLPVVAVGAGGPAARGGLRAGDVLLRVDGQAMVSEAAYDQQARHFLRSAPAAFELRRGGEPLRVTVEPGQAFPWQRLLGDLAIALVYLVTGLLALQLATGYLNSSLLFLLCSAIAVESLLPVDAIGQPLVGIVVGVAFYFACAAQAALELHLALLVPERPAALRQPRWAWVVPAIYGVWAAVATLGAGALLAEQLGFPWPLSEAAATTAVFGLVPLGALGALVLLGSRAVGYPEPEGRLQAGIVFLGVLPWAGSELTAALLALAGQPAPAWRVWDLAPLVLLTYPAAILLVLLRGARQRERLLLELSARVEGRDTPAEVARLVADDLQAALHPRWVRVYQRHDGEPMLSHATGAGTGELTVPQPSLCALADLVDRERQLLEGRGPRGLTLPAAESAWLASSGTELIVPLSGPSQRLSGMLLLGAKKSEEPYTRRERRLLAAFGSQVATAWENLLLRDELAAGREREREVLARLDGQGVELVRECPRCGRCYDFGEALCSRDGNGLVVAVPVERLVAGRYRLERLLGKGGMGAAYEASDLRLRRSVAVKVLLPSRFGDPQARRRFEREAQLSARLRHRHLVAVHDFGETETGGAFLVMERLEGMSLQAALERYGPVMPETAAGWLDQLLDGLGAVHREGIVHRDLKPSNVFLARTAESAVEIKLLDFGIAKEQRAGISSLESLTLPGAFLGTLPYMSPEQVAGEEVDARSDLFSCGVVLVEMLTGRRPFDGATTNAVQWEIMSREVHLPGVDPRVAALDRALGGLLAKKPWRRYGSAAEARVHLVAALRACPPLAGLAGDPEPPTAAH